MFRIIEIIIIALTGAAAVGFFIRYFINEIKGKKTCASCAVKDFCVESKIKKEGKRRKEH